jgi:hypothetical protein
MKKTISNVYGSTSSDGMTLNLQVNTNAGPVDLALPAVQLPQLFTLLIQLAQQAGQAQGLPASPSNAIYTHAVRVAPASVGYTVVDGQTSALLAHCGAVSLALELPHKTVLLAAQQVQNLLADPPHPDTPPA